MSQWMGFRYFFLAIFGAGLLVGCITSKIMPRAPKLPETKLQTLEEVIRRDTPPNKHSPKELPSFKEKYLGLKNFSKEGGAMVADMISIELLKIPGIKLVDREAIEEIEAELKRTAEGLIKLSERARLRKVGELAGADYFLIGSVTEFNTRNMSITLNKLILEGEEERYSKEYGTFVAEVEAIEVKLAEEIQSAQMGAIFTYGLSTLGSQQAFQQRIALEKLKLKTPSLDEFKSKMRGKQHFVTVANIGITAKLIDVRTSKPIWVFQISKRDIDLRSGVEDLVFKVLKSLLKNTPH